MKNSLRQLVEKIVFAGMKPGVKPSEIRRMRWLAPYRRIIERFLSGAAPDDPFYLSNRTLGERAKFGVLVALPVLLVAGVIAWGVLGYIELRDKAPAELTTQQVAAKMLPDLNKPMDLDVNHDLEVLEARVQQGEPTKLVGSVRNLTDRTIDHAHLVFDLTDARGSRVGAVTVPLESIPAQRTVKFELPIQPRSAAFALRRAE
ncbi:MAG TPA: FxLYD domain-containing protein [Bryobacteraceae bacterium]|nr:FxLYD domain-containing protein [Bryobacteraceae bacterium]